MNKIFILLIITSFSLSLKAQREHIKQSTPFENVLISLKTDSVKLFMRSFSKRIVAGETNENIWLARLQQGQAKFNKRFKQFELKDFTYSFNKESSELIIYYKNKELQTMRVVKEKGCWKLDEK